MADAAVADDNAEGGMSQKVKDELEVLTNTERAAVITLLLG